MHCTNGNANKRPVGQLTHRAFSFGHTVVDDSGAARSEFAPRPLPCNTEGNPRCNPSRTIMTNAYFDDPHCIDFKAVIDGVEQNDPLCLDALDRWTVNLGWFLVSVVHLFAPEIIILSGGATNAARHFLEPVQAHVNRHIFRYPAGEPVPIVISQMSDHAGVLGAAVPAWELVNKT
jgi:predicted NBD/HSP70 family sugar kinase